MPIIIGVNLLFITIRYKIFHMKRKLIGLTSVAASLIALCGALLFATSNITLPVFSSPNSEYSITFDHSHNYNPHLYNSNHFKKFYGYTQRGTELEFLEQSLYTDENGWCYAQSTGGLLNTTKIGGLSDITVTFSNYDDDWNAEVNIKYGWVVGSDSDIGYSQSPLDKYEDTLTSGETFYFSNLNPSYFFIQFKYATIESIVIHFSCVESVPSVADQPHYELVKSLSEINSTDIYAISNVKDEAGYMMSTAKYRENYADDKIRQVVACAPSNEQVEDNESILQLKITKSDNLYYFQAQNYLGTYPTGYFQTGDNNKNELFIGPEESRSGFEMTMNEDYLIHATCTMTTYSKLLSYYHDASSNYFNCYQKFSGKQEIYLYKFVDVQEETLTLNYSGLTSMSKSYANGNYGKLSSGGFSFEYYRTVRATNNSSGYAFSMINPNYYYGDNGYPSSFYNISTSPIYGIKSIAVTYKATSGIKISYSKIIGEESYSTLAASNSYVTNSITVDKMNFFKIMTNGSDAYIQDITVTYSNKPVTITSNTSYEGNRKSVTPYSGTLTNGVSTATMYISETETKTYTYYSKQYAYDNYNSIDKSKAFMIDPVDVCNYYLAFHEFPANYVTSGEKSTYGSKFGSYARQVSTYSRTDGYATAVPYNNRPGQSTPIYYELDIDVNGSYSLSSRQVGRVVVWEYGFSCYSTNSEVKPVCVYTDDHYATFQEYNCMGGFAHRFNSERSVVNKVYTPLTLVA